MDMSWLLSFIQNKYPKNNHWESVCEITFVGLYKTRHRFLFAHHYLLHIKNNLSCVSKIAMLIVIMLAMAWVANNTLAQSTTKDNITKTPEERKVFLWYKLDEAELNQFRNETISEVNKFRRENGLKEVVFDEKAQNIAQQYADYCAKYNWQKWHYDMKWRWLWERCVQNGYYWGAKENLYFWLWTPHKVVQGRIQYSEPHKRNMMDERSRYIWVWIAKFENGCYVYALVLL